MNPRRLPDETIAAILADYKAGVPTAEIAARHKVSEKTVNRYSKEAGLRRTKPAQPRPKRPCEECGAPSTYRVCRTCTAEGVALRGGRWIPHNGIMRWEPDEAEPKVDPTQLEKPRRGGPCVCGATPTSRLAFYCEFCRDEMKRASWRQSKARSAGRSEAA